MEWLTLSDFERAIPDEDAAERWFIQCRWPNGPQCGDCGSTRVTRLDCRPRWWSCKNCRHQTSLTSGTPLHGTRKPLRDWVYVLWQCNSRASITARRLKRELGYASYETAWTMLHKVRSAMGRWQPPLDAPRVWMGLRHFAVRRRAKGDPRRLWPMLTAIASDRDPRGGGLGKHVVLVALDHQRHARDTREHAVSLAAWRPESVRFEWEAAEGARPEELRHASDAVGAVAKGLSTFIRRFGGVSRRYFQNYLAQFLVAAGIASPRLRLEALAAEILEQWRPPPDLLTAGRELL
jgi:hypothetical protein